MRRTVWRNSAVRSRRPRPGELAERLGRARLRFGIALPAVRQQHLLEQARFALGERAVHAEVPRLDAVPHERRRTPARSRARRRRTAPGRRSTGWARRARTPRAGPRSSSVMPAARASSARVRLTPLSAVARSSGPSSSRTCAEAERASALCAARRRLLEQRLDGGGIDSSVAARRLRPARLTANPPVAVDLVEPLLDHLQRQEVLALLAQDEAQPFDVGRVELAVARRRALGIDEPLALEEADLRDRDVGELVAELVRARRRSTSASAWPCSGVPLASRAPSTKLEPVATDLHLVAVAQHAPRRRARDSRRCR